MNAEMAGQEAVRHQIHGIWASVAPNWAQHADYLDERGGAITAAMLDRVALQPGDRVLELACGPGGVGLVAAERVGETGEVVLSDVAVEMTTIAEKRASELGMTNVRTAVLDLEQIDQPDDTYDVVLCREGLMFAVEPDRAAREMHRVLHPGGRIAIAVWGPRARNPWLGELFDAVTEVTGFPVPPPGIPGPFSLDDAEQLRSLLTGAGLSGVVVEDLEAPLRAPSFEAHWERTTALAGPLAGILSALPPDTQQSVADRFRAALSRYATPKGMEIPGVTLIASGRRA